MEQGDEKRNDLGNENERTSLTSLEEKVVYLEEIISAQQTMLEQAFTYIKELEHKINDLSV